MKHRAWVQAAVDVDDYQTAQIITEMAVANKAEWIEVGHALLMKYGFEAIRKIRSMAGDDVRIVADYKNEMCGDYMQELKEAGADYVIVEAAYADFLIKRAVENGKAFGITPIFFVNTRCDLLPARAAEVAQMGAQYLFLHRYYRGSVDGKEMHYDHIKKVKELTGCCIGVSSDDLDEALSAIDEGADWITFGRVLRVPEEESCRKWIDTIHGHEGKARQ